MSRVLEQKNSKQKNVWQRNTLNLWQKARSVLSMEKSTDNKGQQRRRE